MSSHFCLSFRFLAPYFHGQADRGEPEWPPSPLRVFQSLLASAVRRGAGSLPNDSRCALEWLERQPPPLVVAPPGLPGHGYRLSVPNNAMDIVARAWSRGNYSNSGDASPATHRTMKAVRPTLLLDGPIHYLWPLPEPLPDPVRPHLQTLAEIARSITVLGWGSDLVVSHAAVLSAVQAGSLPGERWLPCGDAHGGGLRTPVSRTLDDLLRRYREFAGRIRPDGSFAPPAPLSAFHKVGYRRAGSPPSRPFAAFSLLKPDASGLQPFDTPRRALTVAGMLRGAVKAAALRSGWPEARIAAFVLGHGEAASAPRHLPPGTRRFAYLPLPSIEARGEHRAPVAGSVRRVMLFCFDGGCDPEIRWARTALAGQQLLSLDTAQPVALLSLIPATEMMVRRYTQPAVEWATVTPVVLPGYDDPRHYRRQIERGLDAARQKELLARLDDRIDALLRKAILQAGFPPLLARHAQLEWCAAGFWPGATLVDRYGIPDHLKPFPRLHVKIRWRDDSGNPLEVPGPICLGGGRFFGLGLFAAC